MVRLKKKVIGNNEYYYLEHSLRKDGRVQKKEKYLGKKIPANLDKLKIEFQDEINNERWYPQFEKIKRNYLKEYDRVPPSAREKDIESFMVKFTYNTQKIEGSTLTLRETAILLEKEFTPGNRPLSDVKEAEAHKKVFYEMLGFEKDLSLQTMLYWHKKLFDSSKPDISGTLRQHQVGISGSKFMPPFPAEINPFIRDLFRWYNRNKTKLHPVELAAKTHLKFVTIHPFADGNGRTGRLLMNFILNKHDYPMLDISYKSRVSYYNALERSQLKKDDNVFSQWFFRYYLKENRRYL